MGLQQHRRDYALVGRMPQSDREVLLLRLANELEDHLDLGVLYCGNAEERRGAVRAWLHMCVELANGLGQPRLAAEFERVFGEVLSNSVPEVIRQPHDYTHDLRPLSSMPRPGVVARQFVDRHPRLARLLGRST